MKIREYQYSDLPGLIKIWNEVVQEGDAFPQTEELTLKTAKEFFENQSSTTVALNDNDDVIGMYILHPNNVGRCSHIANSSYAVSSKNRGNGIGEKLVKHSLANAKEKGFKVLQFNAVVATNDVARRLYENLGFQELGRIPNGFELDDGTFVDIYPYIYNLDKLDENEEI